MKPEWEWTPELDAIITNPMHRASVNAMLVTIRETIPEMTRAAVKYRRLRLMRELDTQHSPRTWDLSVYTPERTEYLQQVWGTETPFEEIKKTWNRLPGKETKKARIYTHASRLGLTRPGFNGRPKQPPKPKRGGIYEGVDPTNIDRLIRVASDRFGSLPVRMVDAVDVDRPAPPRRGIMSGPPPDIDRIVAARAQMARQGRMAVVDVGVRGLA